MISFVALKLSMIACQPPCWNSTGIGAFRVELFNDLRLILVAAAKRNPFKETAFSSHLVSLEMLIKILLQYEEHVAALEQSVEALAEELME
ncbi:MULTISPECIES: hypothetical protein [Paenibacillus]|uniref:hypothetical protein n=1 Tax=Paenibacillus TaxID=44249 RepID=UPI0022B90B87|nr:hypothetical protein [Paenibacillus caseinilyticus]MCZ8523814.1 hypothetical protein [Paenibacillus caseinilyticus]